MTNFRKVWRHAIGSSNVDRYRWRGQRLGELAALDPFKYERQWKIAGKQLSVRPSVVDAIRFQFHAPELKADREMVLAAGPVLNPSIATA